MTLNVKSGAYVQYGCGLCAPPDWRNFDVSPTLRLQKLPIVGSLIERSDRFPSFPENVEYGDIVKGLPVEDGSCEAVYCSHTLEHLSREDLRAALANTRRILKPGGVFRFVLPDLKNLAQRYLESDDPEAAPSFMRATSLGVERRPRGLEGLLRGWMGNSAHLWMWDYESLKAELERAGFSDVRRASYGDNPDERFTSVEEKGRWMHQLGMECRR